MQIPTATQLPETLVPSVRDAARDAGDLALRFFRRGEKTVARVWSKGGGSPVTEADMAVDELLKSRLSQALPDAGWLSEETADDPIRLTRRLVWIVDPIDGTRAFLTGHPDWCVAIALLIDGRPVHGIVYAPVQDAFYEASLGGGAFRNGRRIEVSGAKILSGARAAGPKPLLDDFERAAGPIHRISKIPSLALRIVRVAEGAIDVGFASSSARDWDLAAADLIVHEAGGCLTDFAGTKLLYNKSEPVHAELAASAARLHPRVIEAMTARWRTATTSR